MAKKKIVIEIEFEEETEDFGDESWSSYQPKKVSLHPDTTMTKDEMEETGERLAQMDSWHECWDDLQWVIFGEVESRELD